jgi:glutamate dehydrogenase
LSAPAGCSVPRPIWQAIETAPMPESARLQLFERTASAMRGHMADLLRAGGAMQGPAQLVGEGPPGVAELVDHVDDLLADEARGHAQAIAADLVAAGAPPKIAAMVANLFAIDGSIGLARLARDTGNRADGADPRVQRSRRAARARLGAAAGRGDDPVGPVGAAARRRARARLPADALRVHPRARLGPRAKDDPMALIAGWARRASRRFRQFRAMIGRAQGANPLAPAMLAQIASQARNLLQR